MSLGQLKLKDMRHSISEVDVESSDVPGGLRFSASTSPPDLRPTFPFGLNLSLNDESLDKLGLEVLPDVGDSFVVVAVARVDSISQSSGPDGDHRNVSLQIEKLSLDPRVDI